MTQTAQTTQHIPQVSDFALFCCLWQAPSFAFLFPLPLSSISCICLQIVSILSFVSLASFFAASASTLCSLIVSSKTLTLPSASFARTASLLARADSLPMFVLRDLILETTLGNSHVTNRNVVGSD